MAELKFGPTYTKHDNVSSERTRYRQFREDPTASAPRGPDTVSSPYAYIPRSRVTVATRSMATTYAAVRMSVLCLSDIFSTAL
jgi:hypothetical protein